MKKIRVLIADDVDIIVAMLEKVLKEIEYVELLESASDGKILYDLIQKLKPNLVLTDVKMPYMTGIEVIEKIRYENNNSVDFILITGEKGDKINKKIEKLNIFDVVSKPFTDEKIKSILNEYMEEQINI